MNSPINNYIKLSKLNLRIKNQNFNTQNKAVIDIINIKIIIKYIPFFLLSDFLIVVI
ncbi:hypothetical protein E27107_90305 [Elizabethkingia anophelis]|nr:hypothetical protein E18064_60455 [Elizabethkingia anophelis]CDN80217.1 hypothetical protein E27107_90305 [Elizabethkingia anophelis]